MRTYSDLSKLNTFTERFDYLRLDGVIGKETFGYDRYLNQSFYKSPEWKRIRDFVILRDNGCDLGLDGYELHGKIYVHHMNPIKMSDIVAHSQLLVDPEYLVCVSFDTHNAIHYGDISKTMSHGPTVRKPGDTTPWKTIK